MAPQTTAEMWWAQGFAKEEDASLKKLVAEYAARPIMTGGKAVIGGLIIAITAITAATIVGRGTAGRQAISPMAATITGDKPGQVRPPQVGALLEKCALALGAPLSGSAYPAQQRLVLRGAIVLRC